MSGCRPGASTSAASLWFRRSAPHSPPIGDSRSRSSRTCCGRSICSSVWTSSVRSRRFRGSCLGLRRRAAPRLTRCAKCSMRPARLTQRNVAVSMRSSRCSVWRRPVRLARSQPMPDASSGVHRGPHEKYRRLIAAAKAKQPIVTAVVHSCDAASLQATVEATRLGLIVPILVGPPGKIEAAACAAGIDLAPFERVAAAHSHDAAAKSVELVRSGRAEALMKGSLHTDELMSAVVARESGIRTARRVSHCFVMDVPGHDQPLIITDAAVNIAPTLEEKVDIVQNAIDLAHALGAAEVRVAILSAMETVNPRMPSTIEAAALCKMADRGQITGAVLDGPLALDNAISIEAASIKQIKSPVAGRANVLIVPDLEAGNMLAKSLTFLAGADAAGVILGARVPIILTSRADSEITRLASCAVALLVADARRASTAAAIR